MTYDVVTEQKDRLFNYKLYIFCTLLHQRATELCSIITNEKQKLKMKIIMWKYTDSLSSCRCTEGANMCN